MNKQLKKNQYQRIYIQLVELLYLTNDLQARMATIVAILHHKMDYFYWTGFYILKEGRLLVSNYQGQLACMELEKDKGVCWAAINQKKAIKVADVTKFPDHIVCDAASRSEIAVPIKDNNGIIGVLDVDSRELSIFDDIDIEELDKIGQLIYNI